MFPRFGKPPFGVYAAKGFFFAERLQERQMVQYSFGMKSVLVLLARHIKCMPELRGAELFCVRPESHMSLYCAYLPCLFAECVLNPKVQKHRVYPKG